MKNNQDIKTDWPHSERLIKPQRRDQPPSLCNHHSQVSNLYTLIWHWSVYEKLCFIPLLHSHSPLSVNSLTEGQQQDGQNPTWWSQRLELERHELSITISVPKTYPKANEKTKFPLISFSEAESSEPGVRRSLWCGQQAFDREAMRTWLKLLSLKGREHVRVLFLRRGNKKCLLFLTTSEGAARGSCLVRNNNG